MHDVIKADQKRWGNNKHLMLLPQYKIIFLKRKCEYWRSKSKLIFIFYRSLYQHYKIKYQTDIPAMAVIGKGFKIQHIGGIVINPHAVIGRNVTILNGVLIGTQDRGKKQGFPTIKDCVWIGTNAIIVGKITIGTNVLIAPGAYVNFDVPDNSIVLGNPGKIITNDRATEGYLTHTVDLVDD